MTSSPHGSLPHNGERAEALPGSVLAAIAAQAEELKAAQKNPATLPQSRIEADRARGEYLMAVNDGLVTDTDVVLAARRADGKPLRGIRLDRLALEAEQGSGNYRRVAQRMSVLTAKLRYDGDTKAKTINWLVDARTAGHRIFVWLDAHHVKKQVPAPGTIWAPARRTAA